MKSERVGRFRKLAGNEFQTAGAMKLKERSPTDLRLRLGIFKSFSLEEKRFIVFSELHIVTTSHKDKHAGRVHHVTTTP